MILPILRWPNPVLATPCAPAVLSEDLRALAADMLDTMYDAPGRGLAAPQVGRSLRLLVMDTTWKEGTRAPRICVNPVIEEFIGTPVAGPEGCLSIPGPTVMVDRAPAVRMRWQDLSGDWQHEVLSGFDAICAQHEYDHLEGIVTLDRLTPEARARAVAEVLA